MAIDMVPERNPRTPVAGRTRAAIWGAPFVLGLLLLALGAVAVIGAGVTGVASVLFFGGILIAAGVVEIVQAVRLRRVQPFLLYLLGGIFSLIVGALFIFRPMAGLGAITLLLGAYFLVSGLFRGITALMDRYASWGWDLVYGAVAIFLGITVFRSWPVSSLWLLGTLVGLEIATRGIALVAGSLAVRKGLQAPRIA